VTLNETERGALLAIARDTVAWVAAGRPGAFAFDDYAITPALEEARGSFVTLRAGPALRGCVGTLEAREALYRSVHENAIKASAEDLRFAPITSEEVPSLDIHVSILSPMKPINSLEQFKPGTHGLLMIRGTARGVFLPEVATEQGWTREQTAAHLCRKIGLPEDAWRDGVEFQVFTTEGIP